MPGDTQPKQESQRIHDVVIVGAGLSGLTACHHLSKAGITDFVVLEAKGRVGGRNYAGSIPSASGSAVWDLGGQWLGPTQRHVLALAKELNLETHEQYDDGYSMMKLSDGVIRKYSGTIPNLPVFSLLELHFYLRKINKLAATIPVDNPTTAPNAVELDQETVESYQNKSLWSTSVRELVDVAVRVIFGCEPSNISLLYFLWYVHCAGSMEQLIETRNGGQDRKIIGGAYRLSTSLAEKLGNQLKLNSPVGRIEQQIDHVDVVSLTGETFRARYVIVAVPPHLGAEITYLPVLPVKREVLMRHMPPGHAIKLIITYQTAFWRSQGSNGSMIDSNGPVNCMFDGCTPAGDPALVGFIVGDDAVRTADWPAEDRKALVLRTLAEFYGKEALTPIAYVEQDWMHEPFNGGGPVPHMPCGVLSECGSALRAPVGRIHWAGTETATFWFGFLNGAVQAGERAASEIVEQIKLTSFSRESKAEKMARWQSEEQLGEASKWKPRRHKRTNNALGASVWMVLGVALAAMVVMLLSHGNENIAERNAFASE